MNNLIKQLNQQVANFGVLYVKLHSFHWFVKGPQFYQLHILFEKLYDEVTEHFDAVAERVLMLEERPYASLKEFLAVASISEATNKENEIQMIQSLVADFTKIDQEITQTIKTAQDLGDEVTVDLLLGVSSSFQKHLWMLRTLLK
jgi:starvation-inducible DNA-binding protein